MHHDDDDDRCDDRSEEEEHFAPYGPGYVASLVAVQDAVVTTEVLDQVLDLANRWPEPRALHQTDVWFMPDRVCLALADLDAEAASALLGHIRALAYDLHAVAAKDEQLTTSTALRWAMEQSDVPLTADLNPHTWLDGTALVRWLTRRTGPRDRP